MRSRMRPLLAILLAAASAIPAAAQESKQFSAWIWADKYVYSPGETITVHWTGKANGDPRSYTAFFYRQNNQDGRKYYLPGNTENVTDYTGRTRDQGFFVVGAGNVTKGVLIGSGGLYGALTAPSDLGMHSIVFELRDPTGTQVLKAVYFKFSVVSEQINISGPITSDTTWVNTKTYRLSGIVYVKGGATLTIQPGTIITGSPGTQPPSALIVTRNGKINAKGSRSRPIVMTSSLSFGQRNRGDWGGLVLLGKAPINVGANTASTSNPEGSFYIEGLAATDDGLYGGTDPNHSCGTLEYVRVEFAGSILSPNNELNSFTFGGCGKGTVANHLQAIYGLDDNFEWFGGNMDAKYLVGGLNADDSLDFQLGWTGRVQFAVFYESPNSRGNRGIEGDNSEYNNDATPFSDPTVYNVTFIGSGQPGFDEADAPGIFLRRGARGTFNNIAVMNFYSPGVSISDAKTQAQMDLGNVKMNGILLFNNSIGTNGAATLAGQITNAPTLSFAQGIAGQGNGKNFLVADPLYLNPLELSDPDWRTVLGSPLTRIGWVAPPDDGFFDPSATFIGGMGDVDWTEEWTFFPIDTDVAH